MSSDILPFVIGIDPGREGAYAILSKSGFLVGAGLCPRFKMGSSWEESWAGMSSVLRSAFPSIKAAYVEQTQAGPIMSKHATHVLAFNGGLWVGMAAALGMRVTLVRPKEWQADLFKGYSARGRPKEVSVLVAGRLWPELDERLGVKQNQGLADAALIAEHGRRQELGGRPE